KRREADTILPVSRWNLISASLVRVSCRQKTAERNYYNCFSRIEIVPNWFGGGSVRIWLSPLRYWWLQPRKLQPRRLAMIARIDHFVLTVQSLEATCEFYERVLGFKRVDAPGRPTALAFGNNKINIHEAQHTFDPKAARPTPGS